ncbi:hypothetical protein OG306_33095 [Streptomyces sp. NBC_01241]|uniref:hypothetical protein n=1 Tax=Streptomyces sp. NBC_01241 TaxID=2903794 RepID=UPI00352C895E|nr:hypothetical protein OG306_33095 [Streptomyces sp. NBC_01241]
MIMWTIAAIMSVVLGLGIGSSNAFWPAPIVHQTPELTEEQEWDAYHAEATAEYADEFTALFNGYETKWAKNGRLMMRTGNSGPYKFVKRAI